MEKGEKNHNGGGGRRKRGKEALERV